MNSIWLPRSLLLVALALPRLFFLGDSFRLLGSRYSVSRAVTSPVTSSLSSWHNRIGPLHAQSLDYTSLFLSVDELANVCVPGKVENIIQENEYNMFVGIKTATGQNVWLQFCWHPSAARIGLGYAPPKGEGTPYSFAATLRSILRGHSVTKVHLQSAFDRIAEVEFSER